MRIRAKAQLLTDISVATCRFFSFRGVANAPSDNLAPLLVPLLIETQRNYLDLHSLRCIKEAQAPSFEPAASNCEELCLFESRADPLYPFP